MQGANRHTAVAGDRKSGILTQLVVPLWESGWTRLHKDPLLFSGACDHSVQNNRVRCMNEMDVIWERISPVFLKVFCWIRCDLLLIKGVPSPDKIEESSCYRLFLGIHDTRLRHLGLEVLPWTDSFNLHPVKLDLRPPSSHSSISSIHNFMEGTLRHSSLNKEFYKTSVVS